MPAETISRVASELAGMRTAATRGFTSPQTAKPTAAERARVPHHLVDILDVTETWDVARYVTAARTMCDDILARGRRVLVSGGSGFFPPGAVPLNHVMKRFISPGMRDDGGASK